MRRSYTPDFLEPTLEAVKPNACGIARMARESEPERVVNRVDYRRIKTASIINRVDGTRADFEWSVNPYRGCELGCVYCYARYTHTFMDHDSPMDFERKIYIKDRAPQQFWNELRSGKVKPGEEIAFGAATDPYQPAEKREGLMRSLLGVLEHFSGYRVTIMTKSDLVLRDMDLLDKIRRKHGLRIQITITTLDRDLARKLEPRAVVPERRLEALRILRENDFEAGVFMMPVMPEINDSPRAIDDVASGASAADARFMAIGTLFLSGPTRQRYFDFLGEHRPDLLALYRRFYSNGSDAPRPYRMKIARLADRIRRRHGLEAWCEPQPPAEFRSGRSQPELFGVASAAA